MKRKLLIGSAIVGLLIVVGIGLLILNLNGITKAGVTRGGSALLGVPVALDEADVSLRGSVGLDGLEMGSPEGYRAPRMFQLGHAHVDADAMSFFGDQIVVRDVVIDGPEITLELKGGKANWAVLLERLQSKSEEEVPPEEEEAEKKMRIDHILFQNGKIHLAGLPTGELTVPLPTVELHDIGKEGESKDLPDTMLRVVQGLYAAILKAVGDVLPAAQMKKLTEDVGGKIGESAGRIGQAGGEAGQKATDAVGDAVSGAAEKGKGALGGIFGGENEDEDEDEEEK